jgi:hypothetical protein
VTIDIAVEMSDTVIHVIQRCTACVSVAFISSCKLTSSLNFCQPFTLFRKGLISREMHTVSNYSITAQHFIVLQAHSFNIFNKNACDRKGRSHQITACRHNGLSRLIA